MNMDENLAPDLIRFFKALADSNRLKIIGLLARESLSVEQLAAILHLSPSTISHHLSKLAEAGLVSASARSYYNIYRLEQKNLENLAQRLLKSDTLQSIASGVDMDAYDRKVISDYLMPDGRLKTIPAQRKKLEAILRYLIEQFETEKTYTEREVNEIIARFHPDTTSLRRELIGAQLLGRSKDGREYWRISLKD